MKEGNGGLGKKKKKMKQCIKLLEPVISIWHASQQ